jgi:hypothetical protein
LAGLAVDGLDGAEATVGVDVGEHGLSAAGLLRGIETIVLRPIPGRAANHPSVARSSNRVGILPSRLE